MAGRELKTGPPDFVGVGTQRSGTTWWQRLLKSHPKIRVPRNRKKEQHFFDRFGRRPMTDADVTLYHDQFPRAPGQFCGEWTPRYMRDVWGPAVVARAAPDTRLLIMFRDPVERYRSGVLHMTARRAHLRPEWVATDATERGRYAEQLRRVYDYFDESQVLILQYEQCVEDPLGQYRRTLEHIRVPFHEPKDVTRPRGGTTRQRREPIWDDLVQALVTDLESDVAELNELVPHLDVKLWHHFAHVATGAGREQAAPRPISIPARSAEGGPPDYVGIGTSHSGSGWWHKLLLEHPSIKRSAGGRSLEFFETFCTRAMTDDDVAEYHSNFKGGPNKVVGEWSSDYMFEAWTPPLLQRAAPDAKLLVMLVDPIVRYGVELIRKRPAQTDTDIAANSPARGRYALQLRRLLRYYERDQILVLQLERCLEDPAGEYARALRFLGVDDEFKPTALRDGPVEQARRVLGRAGVAPLPPKIRRPELWPELATPLLKHLEPDVRDLLELVPELDISLWPDFAHLADRGMTATAS